VSREGKGAPVRAKGFLFSFSLFPRVTCRTKRNPLQAYIRNVCVPDSRSISIYITLSLFFRAASSLFTPSVSLSSHFLFLPSSRSRIPPRRTSPAVYFWRRTTTKTHLLDQPASSLASYSILWPPTLKRRPGLCGKVRKYRRQRQIARW